jgi:4-amino-4-deoxy-L-arabinose transferase-like glycosyltransferase
MRTVKPILIASAAAILFLHSLGKVNLFDWDEINFAESSREMIVSGDYTRVQINFEPFWEKPPLFFWLQVLSMKAFGINEYAARLPNAVCGILTLLTLFLIGRRLHGERFGLWWAFLYGATVMPHAYFKSGIIDPWFNFLIFLGVYFLSDFLSGGDGRRWPVRPLMLSALCTGLAVLTKGPVALLLVLLTYALSIVWNRGKGWVPFRYYLVWAGVFAAVTLAWFGMEVWKHGWWFMDEFVKYQLRLAGTQDAGFKGFPGYTFVVLLVGCFPASILILRFRNRLPEQGQAAVFRTLMVSALVVTYVVFSLVRTKVLHYSAFAHFPIGYLAASTLQGLLGGTSTIRAWQRTTLLVMGLLWGLLFTLLPWVGTNVELLRPFISADRFALANLDADVTWGYAMMLPGIAYMVAVVASWHWMRRARIQRAFFTLLAANILMLQYALTEFAPRIEGYSQRAAIEFFRSVSGQHAYAETVGYKSYAPYFYFAVPPGNRKETKDEKWLLSAERIDRPAYLVVRVDKRDGVLREFGDRLEVLYEKNGYVFMVRRK